jgi:rod shape-determining protein MreD
MKSFSKILHFFILIICLILQVAFFDYLDIFLIRFDLVMVAVIAVALFDGTMWGMIFGFVAGMAIDLMAGNIVGISAFIYSADAFMVRKLITAGFKSRLLTYIFIVFIITEINILTVSLIYYLFNFSISRFGMGLDMIIGPLCNIILVFVIFPIIRIGKGMNRETEFEFKYKDEI